MKLLSVIFDLDGVLCHTDRYHFLAWKTVADRLEIAFDERVNNRLRGVSRMESLNIILETAGRAYSEEEKQRLAEEKNRIYREYLRQMGPEDLTPGALDTLKELRRRGLSLAVGSSSRNAPFILDQIGLATYFDAVADGNQIRRSKPDPEVFLLAAEKLNIAPNQCMVVEDAAAGIQAAKQGGFFAVGIGEASADPRADASILTLPELLRFVDDLRA